mmetsp:Transcript_7385/g.13738  ORF Transcript_7385/g.13738 Transcript_7385/m.13738 type:complete len:244 (-) Transcript_7385:1170-1901(-)
MTSLDELLESSMKVDDNLARLKSHMTLQYIDDQFPELRGMLEEPLMTQGDFPCLQCADRVQNLQDEYQRLLTVLYMVNEDRVRLRLRLIDANQNAKDDFQEFITKTQAIHYELMKKVVEHEREVNDRLHDKLKQLGGDLPELSNKPCQTDQISIEIKGFACSMSSIGADSHYQTPAMLSPDDSMNTPHNMESDDFFSETPVSKVKEHKKVSKTTKVRQPVKVVPRGQQVPIKTWFEPRGRRKK